MEVHWTARSRVEKMEMRWRIGGAPVKKIHQNPVGSSKLGKLARIHHPSLDGKETWGKRTMTIECYEAGKDRAQSQLEMGVVSMRCGRSVKLFRPFLVR